VLKQMGLSAQRSIAKRAFTKGRAAKSTKGKPASPLSPRYKKRKAELGKGTRPDQRLTDKTAKALGIVRETPTEVVVGFNTELARNIAESLDNRNSFWGLSSKEAKQVLDIVKKSNKARAKGTRIGGTVKVQISL
jgi:hypothetical protein